VREERRQRIESNPQGKLQETALAAAFAAHPYRNLGAGWASDIESFRASEARAFFQTYYVPGNITIGIAGDVNPAEMKRLAERYFGSLPAAPMPPELRTVEPTQEGERRVTVETAIQPFLIIGYKRPDQRHKDDVVYDVLSTILSSGRTGLLYKELVRDMKIALAAMAVATLPGGKYPCLFTLLTAPTPGHTVEENEKAVYGILERLKREKVDTATLERAKTKMRANFIRQLDSNPGLASELASYHASYGDWRRLFTAVDEIGKVTAEDVQRVAQECFAESSRTVAYTVAPKSGTRGGSR
jgi:predicted Zn-dependent peptidase